MIKTDYIKKYNLTYMFLAIWILFIPMKNTIYQIFTILILFLGIYHIVYFRKYEIFKTIIIKNKQIFYAFSFILLSMLLSSILSENILHSLSISLKFIYRYIFIFIILLYFYEEGFFSKQFLYITILVSLSIYAIDGIYQFITGYDFFKNLPKMGNGLTGPTFNRNVFGSIMAIATIVSFSILILKNNLTLFYKIILLLLLNLFLFNLLFSLSRASWLFLFIYMFFFIGYSLVKKQIYFKNFLFILSIILLVIFAFSFNDLLMMRLQELLNGNSSYRYDIWLGTLNKIKEHLLFGYGIDTFMKIVTNRFAGTHNIIFEILLFLGLVGLIAYIYFFLIIISQTYYKNKIYCLFFFLSFLFQLQFDGSLIYSKLDLSILTILLFLIFSDEKKIY